MKNIRALLVAASPSMALDRASAQSGTMMNGTMSGDGWMGGYGGVWIPILLVVIVGLLGWLVVQKRK